MKTKASDPDTMNAVLSAVLRYGVILSAAITMLGTALALERYGLSSASQFVTYLPNQVPHEPFSTSLGAMFSGVLAFDPFSIIELGVVALMATPVARVLISIFLFAAEKDRLYVYITAVVLTLLLFSMLVTPSIPLFHA